MKIGIDLGGSHVGVSIVNKSGEIIAKKELDIKPKDKEDSENFILVSMLKLINKVLDAKNMSIKDIELIGIAAPGLIKKGVIIKSKNLNLNKFPMVSDLKKFFPIPVILRNDGKCAALAEKEYGILKPYSDSIFLTIGTGIGGAVFSKGKLLEAPRSAGFELGHMIIEKDGRKCSCGNNGCFEAYASIGNFRKQVEQKLHLEQAITGKQLLELLKKEELNKETEPILEEYIEYLSIGIANLVNIFEPEAVVLGGSIVYYESLILERLKNNIRKKNYLYNEEIFPKILMAKLKNDAGMIGATIEKK